jgi:hypothetical protein
VPVGITTYAPYKDHGLDKAGLKIGVVSGDWSGAWMFFFALRIGCRCMFCYVCGL